VTVDGVAAVLTVLEANGFQRLPKPLLVGGTTFDFDAAVTGTDRSHDLVIVSGTNVRPRRLIQLLSGLNRTLDTLASPRPVSLVLLAPQLDRSEMVTLEQSARILRVASKHPTEEEVIAAVSVLLPLRLPQARQVSLDPLDELAESFASTLSDEHRKFIHAARMGPDAVRDVLSAYLDDAIGPVEAPTKRDHR